MKTKPNSSRDHHIHDDLTSAIDKVYSNIGVVCTQPIPESESADYYACTFKLDHRVIKYRIAKITPRKTGQFVTLWKRNTKGPIQPFEISDNIDLFIISIRNQKNFGQFIFPGSILYEKGIVAGNNKAGKLAIRVYPPWNTFLNKQAKITQSWQLNYFLKIPDHEPVDLIRAKQLLHL